MGYKFPEAPNVTLEEGNWTEYGDLKLKIAYAQNNNFLRAKTKHERPYRRQIEKGDLDPVDLKKILIKAMAEGILMDWSGFEGDVKHSIKAAEILLTNDEEIRTFVMEYSMELANFRNEERKHEGNS